jgi:hypothetical protein
MATLSLEKPYVPGSALFSLWDLLAYLGRFEKRRLWRLLTTSAPPLNSRQRSTGIQPSCLGRHGKGVDCSDLSP